MVRPPENEIRRLNCVAREMFDSSEESGYLVGVATGHHPAFRRSKRPSSSLERELFVEAARRAASREGFDVDESGGGLDLLAADGARARKYRVKAGSRTAAGDYRFVCGLGSSLLTTEPDTLLLEERWILGYLSSDDHTLNEVIAAHVTGFKENGGSGPVTLTLGPVIPLSITPPPRSFTSTDEGLDGFDDDGEADDIGVA